MQYAYAECQVKPHIHIVALNLVTAKCQYLTGNSSVICASVVKFLPFCNVKFRLKTFHQNFTSICLFIFSFLKTPVFTWKFFALDGYNFFFNLSRYTVPIRKPIRSYASPDHSIAGPSESRTKMSGC
jgi:hypothetical protein